MRNRPAARRRPNPIAAYLFSFLVVLMGLTTALCVTHGILGDSVDELAGKNRENFALDLDRALICGLERDGDVWTKETSSTAFIDVTVSGRVSRLTLAFKEPLSEYLQLSVGYLKGDATQYTPDATRTVYLNKGDTFAEAAINQDVTALRVSFISNGNLRFRLDSMVINSERHYLEEKFRGLPWPWIFCMAVLAAYILGLAVRRRLRNRALSATVCFALLMALALYRKFLTGDISYLYTTTDGFSQYLPTYESYARNLRENGYLPWWSFSIGFGSLLSYDVLLYPLNAIPFFSGVLWGSHALEMSFAWMQAVKIALAALFMFLLLKEIGISSFPCSLVSILYAFCGIIVLRGNWGFLADEVYIAAALLWAVERYFRKGQWYFIPLMVLLLEVCLGMYYLYLYAVLLFVYATVRFIYAGQPFRKYFAFIFKCGGLYLFGILVWSIVLIGFGWSLFATERFSDTKDYLSLSGMFGLADSDVLLSALLRAFSTDSLGVYEKYSGSLNHLEGPLLYCGISCLFLVPQALVRANRRLKWLIAFGCAAAGAYLALPIVTDVLNAFIRNEELGLRSYRLSSLWICIMMLVMSAYGLECGIRRGKFDVKTVLASGTILCTLFLYGSQIAGYFKFTPDHIVGFKVVLFLFAWMIALAYYKGVRGAKGALMLLAIAEVFVFSGITIGGSYQVALDNYTKMHLDDTGYYGSIPDAVAYIHDHDDGLYRVGGADVETGVARYSSPLYFGVFSSTYYTDIDDATHRFLQELYPESFDSDIGSKYSVGVENSLCLSTLTGYKYYIAKTGTAQSAIPFGYVHIKTVGNMEIYRNAYALPFGFAYDVCMTKSEFLKLKPDQKKAALLACAVVEDSAQAGVPQIADETLSELGKRVAHSGASGEDARFASDMGWYKELASSRERMEITSWREDHIAGTIDVSGDKILFFPIANVSGWTLWIDGVKTDIFPVNLGFFGAKLSAGTHHIELRYQSMTLHAGAAVSLAMIALYLILLLLHKKLRWMRPNINLQPTRPAKAELPGEAAQTAARAGRGKEIDGKANLP